MMESATVHVVDDDDSMRTSLVRLLRARGLAARGYASAGEFLLQPSFDHRGCILLDLNMPGPSGLDLQAALHEKGVELPIVFITGQGSVAACATAMRSGAVDFLEKPVDSEVLIAVVDRALSRDDKSRLLIEERLRLQALLQSLSSRERQIFDLVASGKLNKQIAEVLNVTERTVKTQRASLMAKLGVDSAAGLGRLAERMSAVSTSR